MSTATRALSSLGLEHGIAALTRALTATQDPEAAHTVAESLLDLAFDGKRVKPYGTLYSRGEDGRRKIQFWDRRLPQVGEVTRPQRTVLEALVAHDPLWDIDSDLLALYGLPTSRGALRELAAGSTRNGG